MMLMLAHGAAYLTILSCKMRQRHSLHNLLPCFPDWHPVLFSCVVETHVKKVAQQLQSTDSGTFIEKTWQLGKFKGYLLVKLNHNM